MTLRVGASFGPYDVLPLEGRGGMAEVYRAHDNRLERDVVALNHPNIAYSPTPDGQRFLVLEAERDKEILLRVITNWAPR